MFEVFTTVLILGLAGLAIGWPWFRYHRTKQDGYLTMFIVHGVIAGLSALYSVLVVWMNGGITIVWTLTLFICPAIVLLDGLRLWIFGK